jgi:RNA polymerase sporulation-specific sigma factor
MALTHHELRELIARGQAGDEAARQQVIEANLRLVWSVAHRFRHRGHDMEDIYQIGCVGLLKAVDQFDLRFEVRFSTYAVPMMMGEIQRYLRDDGKMRVSRSLKELHHKLRIIQEQFTEINGRSPTLLEMQEASGAAMEQIHLALNAFRPVHSMEENVFEQDGDAVTWKEHIADQATRPALEQVILRDAIQSLPVRDRKFIFLRYFRDQTQTEIAQVFGISQVQVSRMEKRILHHLRERNG